MTITAIGRNFNGDPNMVTIVTDNTLTDITTAGFWALPDVLANVKALNNGVFLFQPTDFVSINYSGGFGIFTFNNATMAFVENTSGGAGVVLPTVAGFIPTFQDTVGTIGMPTTSLRANFSIVANNGFGFYSEPALPGTGRLSMLAQDTGGGFDLFINNTTMTQNTAMTIPNVTNAAGRFAVAAGNAPYGDKHLIRASGTTGVVIDSGAAVFVGTTATFGGGGVVNNFTITGMTNAWVGNATIRTSTNAVSIAKATPGAGFLTVTFSADPGANTTLDYTYYTGAIV